MAINNTMEIKDRIRYLRESRDWTITDLAKNAEVGRTTIIQIETGRNKPSADVLEKLADVFEVSTDYLLGREKKKISGIKMMEIKDSKLLKQFREIDQLPTNERKTIKDIISVFLKKKSKKSHQ